MWILVFHYFSRYDTYVCRVWTYACPISTNSAFYPYQNTELYFYSFEVIWKWTGWPFEVKNNRSVKLKRGLRLVLPVCDAPESVKEYSTNKIEKTNSRLCSLNCSKKSRHAMRGDEMGRGEGRKKRNQLSSTIITNNVYVQQCSSLHGPAPQEFCRLQKWGTPFKTRSKKTLVIKNRCYSSRRSAYMLT